MDIVAPDVPSSAEPPVDTRRPPRRWLAALLSLVNPGLGHVYLWRLRAALGFAALVFVVGALAIGLVIGLPGAVLPAAVVGSVLMLNVAIAAHAWRKARVPTAWRPSRGLLAFVLIGWFVAFTVAQELLQRWVKRNVVEAFHIPSGAMEPTVLVGDFLFARVRRGDPLERDELYTFRRDGSLLLMRVVGLAGDTLAMRGGTLLRNGGRVREPYTRTVGEPYGTADDFAWQRSSLLDTAAAAFYRPTADDWGPLVVPPDSVFVLGDNRHSALDSRFRGPVAENDVVGYPTKVYFSRAPGGGVRWERIGVHLD